VDHYQHFSKEWIVSPTARRVYRAAAVVSLTVYASLVALIVYGPIPALKQFLFVGVLATAINGTGMEFFLFRFDDSPAWEANPLVLRIDLHPDRTSSLLFSGVFAFEGGSECPCHCRRCFKRPETRCVRSEKSEV